MELRIIKYLLAAQKDVVALFIRPSFECFEDFVLPYTSVSSGSVHESTQEKCTTALFLRISLHDLLRC
jgi:hypothetical protein